MRIAISITTHNRYDVFKKTFKEIKRLKPINADIFIVDDGSDVPVKEATFRFDTPHGIAAAKNKCFELADGYDYHFAFDDDVYPIKEGWHLEYILSNFNHLCFTFDKFSNGRPNGRIKVGQEGNFTLYKEPCGCMNFYTKACFDVVGGMDTEFGKWSYEHVGHSVRIFNAGLTKYPFMDVSNSLSLFYSFDWDQTTDRSVAVEVRNKLAIQNERKYRSELKSKRFIPYMPQKNLVLTCYFITLIDPQRGTKWPYEVKAINGLKNSIPKDVEFKIIRDFDACRNREGLYHYDKPKNSNPYLAKWISFRDYIITHPEYDNIAMLDGTDTEIMNNPFASIDREKLYPGDEPGITSNQWLINHHNIPIMHELLNAGRLPLLNAGILIGHRKIVLRFLDKMIELIETNQNVMTDMLYFNYVLRKYFGNDIVHGRKVNTVFKSFDNINQNKSWIKHK